MIKCALTGKILHNPIYKSQGNMSVTSLSQIYEGKTIVYFNEEIGHLQTKEIEDIETYYDKQYQFFNQSDEDDILYKIVDGKKIFRQQHQVNTLLSKINLEPGMKILDYGCAKGTVMKRLVKQNPYVETYLFDVSQMYVSLWKKFLPSNRYATYETKKEWQGVFDIVTSFFALEHTPNPLKELQTIHSLLKNNGIFYFIVPNVHENTGDFIVADHVHHYSKTSLHYLMGKAGFETIEIDTSSHFGAYIAIGKKVSQSSLETKLDSKDLAKVENSAIETAKYWNTIQYKIRIFEESVKIQKSAIYGAGVYGSFILTCLDNLENIKCFLDQNPLLLNTELMGKKIYHPDALPEDVKSVYVGLNPKISYKVISSLESWKRRDLSIFYI